MACSALFVSLAMCVRERGRVMPCYGRGQRAVAVESYSIIVISLAKPGPVGWL